MKHKRSANLLRKLVSAAVMLVAFAFPAVGSDVGKSVGSDLLPVFARAHQGGPLRAVAIGGSITQAGEGWVGPWLSEQFPQATVTMHNAGMSATGSLLGLFRLDRDVISAQPDLVFIEYAVNDGSGKDEDVIRWLESIVVRLKSLPHPPAIVFLEAAAKGGSKRERHQQVARHYGLLDIDLQVAVDQHLAKTGEPWSSVMGDNVHPNAEGHKLYTKAIGQALAPFIQAARTTDLRPPTSDLPLPITSKPLLLDGRLVPLSPQPGWGKQHSLPHWWSMFFNGVISASEPGTELILPVRGTAVGLYFAMGKDTYGSFYVNIDGNEPRLVDCSTRGGYSYTLLGKDLTPEEHVVRLAVAKPLSRDSGPVKIGYLLVAGETEAKLTLAPQGSFRPVAVAKRAFNAIPARAWQWSGPYGGSEKTTGPTADLHTVFPAETNQPDVEWKALEGDDPKINFGTLTGRTDRGVCYARTTLQHDTGGNLLLALRIDYFGKLWLNGELIKVIDSTHGNPNAPMLIPVTLKAGDNEIVVKVHSGSAGNFLALAMESAEVNSQNAPQ